MGTRITSGFPAIILLIPVMAATHGVAEDGGSGVGLVIPKPLMAHWTFDEPSGDTCRDASGQGRDAGQGRLTGIRYC